MVVAVDHAPLVIKTTPDDNNVYQGTDETGIDASRWQSGSLVTRHVPSQPTDP